MTTYRFDFTSIPHKLPRDYQPQLSIPAPDLGLFDFRPQGQQAAPKVDDTPLSPLAWAEANRRIDDRPFSLDRFAPLRTIYDDDHPHIVVIKPAQVGVSEMALTRTLHALAVGSAYWQTGQQGVNVGYIFPTETALRDFAKERFADSYQLFDDYNDVSFKKMGYSYLYLRGASLNSLTSFPADMIVLDEYDRIGAAFVELARKRMRQSTVKREIDLSTPTVPGVGIHAEYLRSDQRVWEVPCACGAWVELDFFRDVTANGQHYEAWQRWDEETIRRATLDTVCPHCCAPIDRLGDGRWTAKAPDIIAVRGYQVPPLAFPSITLLDLCVKAISHDPTVVTEFYRSDLGLPYEPAGSRITDEMLNQLSHMLDAGVLPAMAWRNTTMGVDIGSRFHYRIDATGTDGERYVLRMGSVNDWDELDPLMSQYRIRRAVVDGYPEAKGALAWSQKHKGKVLRASYPAGDRALENKLYYVNEDEGTIKINRTMAMDGVFARVAEATERWPVSIHRDPEVMEHMKAPIRVEVADKRGELVATWVHTRPDHMFHCGVYVAAAFDTLPTTVPSGLSVAIGSKGWGVRK